MRALAVAGSVTLCAWLSAGAAAQQPPRPGTIPRTAAGIDVPGVGVKNGRLQGRASIAAAATGVVAVSLRAAGRTTAFSVPIRDGAIRIDRTLTTAQRTAGTGVYTLHYEGNRTVRPDSVTLRAAPRSAALKRRRASIDAAGRLSVSGTITRSARGSVRVRLVYGERDEKLTFVSYRADIRNGAWTLARTLPSVARKGGELSTEFAGSLADRIRGERDSTQVAP